MLFFNPFKVLFYVNGAVKGILKNWKNMSILKEVEGQWTLFIYHSNCCRSYFLQWIKLLCLCLKGFLVACKKVEHDGTKRLHDCLFLWTQPNA
jgi:hypothetical protein